MTIASSPGFLPLAGVAAGIVLGFAARRQHVCTMAALERHWYSDDSSGLRTWVLAAAVALALTQGLELLGHVDTRSSFYLAGDFAWTGAIVGGFAFGVGMALAGTCSFGALVRAGGGSLRSIVVLIVIGLSGLAAQRGIVAQGRVKVVDDMAVDLSFAGDQSMGSIVSSIVGVDVRVLVAAGLALAMFWWVFRDAKYRRNYGRIVAGSAIGGVIAFGWAVTTLAHRQAFFPVQIEAGSFVVPLADSILQLVVFTGTLPDYGVGLVAGVILGAAACAYQRNEVRWEACDDARELGRHLLGGVLMGTGGVFAMGCTVGQGVTALSAMAISAPVVVVSIAIGARFGLAYLIEGSPLSGFRPLPLRRASVDR